MMVRFDDETTNMQVRAPLLERVDNGKQLPFMHRIILFCAGGFPRGKCDWIGSSISLMYQDCADANFTRVARYNVRL
jgi:hypothetical protein